MLPRRALVSRVAFDQEPLTRVVSQDDQGYNDSFDHSSRGILLPT